MKYTEKCDKSDVYFDGIVNLFGMLKQSTTSNFNKSHERPNFHELIKQFAKDLAMRNFKPCGNCCRKMAYFKTICQEFQESFQFIVPKYSYYSCKD